MNQKINLRLANSCDICAYQEGWCDHLWCSKHAIEIRPGWLCDDFSPDDAAIELYQTEVKYLLQNLTP